MNTKGNENKKLNSQKGVIYVSHVVTKSFSGDISQAEFKRKLLF